MRNNNIEIQKLVNRVKTRLVEQETNEGIFDPITNAYQGLKGVWRGEGYDYFKYLSSLRNQVRTLNQLDEPNKKIFRKLNELKNKINSSKMPQQKKQNIINAIDLSQQHFVQYRQILDSIENLISQKFN